MSSSDSPPTNGGTPGVRNLRAKFEEQSVSSPTRGRSPATSRHASTDGSSGSQTRNTIRASFVAVEPIKPEMDDRRITPEACVGSTAHKRRESFSMDQSTDFKAMAEVRGTINSELEKRMKGHLIEPVSEVAVVTPGIERGESELFPKMKKPIERHSGLSKQEAAGNDAIEPTSSDDGDRSGQTVEPVDKPTSEDNTPSPEKQQDSSPEKIQESNMPDGGKSTADQGEGDVKEPTRTAGSTASKNVDSPSTGGSNSKRKSIMSRVPVPGPANRATTERTARTTSRSSSAKNTKLPVTPTVSKKPSTRDDTKARPLSQVNKPEGQHTAPTSATTRARARTKSPTRPVKLPQSATAPTTSFAAKTSTGSIPPNGGSRPGPAGSPSGTTQNNGNFRRQASKREPTKPNVARRVSGSHVGDTGALSHRPADGGVPKRQSVRAERNTSGEGFLARMMRPTVSSASKVHEKPTNAPKSGPTNERTTTGKTKQSEKRKSGAHSVTESARTTQAGLEQASEGGKQVTEIKEQVPEGSEQIIEKKEQDTEGTEQVMENKEQVSQSEEQVSESKEPHEEVPADGNGNGNAPHSPKEAPGVIEGDEMAEKGQAEQVAEPIPA